MKCKKQLASLCVVTLVLTTLASAAAPGTAPLEAPPALENAGENAITPSQFVDDYTTNTGGLVNFYVQAQTRLRFYLTNEGTDTVSWKIQYKIGKYWFTPFGSSFYGTVAPGASLQFSSCNSQYPPGDYRFVANNWDGTPIRVVCRVNQLDVNY